VKRIINEPTAAALAYGLDKVRFAQTNALNVSSLDVAHSREHWFAKH